MTDNVTRPNANESGPLIRFFSNPAVGIIGSVASVIGVTLAIIFFTASSKYRELVYCVYPSNAVVVKAGETSLLRVLVGEEELHSDVTAAQIAIWNRGKESIRAENVLDNVKVSMHPPSSHT